MVVLTSKSIIKHHLYDADFGDAHISRTSGISSNLRVIIKAINSVSPMLYLGYGIEDLSASTLVFVSLEVCAEQTSDMTATTANSNFSIPGYF